MDLLLQLLLFVVVLAMVIKFFQLVSETYRMHKTIRDFTQYYYKLNEYKLAQEKTNSAAGVPAGNTASVTHC